MAVIHCDPHSGRRPVRTRPAGPRRLHALALGALFLGAAASAHAVPFSSDISITGSLAFDDATAFVGGDGTHSGSLTATQGGSDTTTTYDDTSVSSGINPLAGMLTDIGDGFSFRGSGSASTVFGEIFGGVDLAVEMANTSVSDSYEVVLGVDFFHSVDAGGADAYIESVFDLFDRGSPGSEMFTDIVSDTFFGDERNLVPLGTFGAEVTDSDTLGLTYQLDPGDVLELAGFYTLEGLFPESGTIAGSYDFGFEILDVSRLSAPPPDVPLPGTVFLLGAGLLGLAGAARRSPRVAQP